MNKRIKSLIVAGMMVVGMSGSVFANEIPQGPFVSYKTHPTLLDESSEAVFQNGAIVVDVSKEELSEQDVFHYSLEWNSHKFKMNKLILFLEDGNTIEEDLNSASGVAQTKDVEGKENFKIFKSQSATSSGSNIVKIQVQYEYGTDTDGDGIPDFKDDEPVTPGKPEISDPETGDSGLITVVGTSVATLSAVGLFLVNKKKEDE